MKEAENIVTAFKSVWGKFARAVCGIPVYKGHPDNPEMANEYPDKTPYGAVSDMEVRDEGLAIKQTLLANGQSLVEHGMDRISPNWYVRKTDEKKNDLPIFEPVAIKSIGLTKKPNIPNLSLVNTKESDMKDLLIALLKTCGITLANDATDESVVAELTKFTQRPTQADLDAEKNKAAADRAKIATLETALANEKTRADASATQLANARGEKIAAVLANAIKQGKITAADKATWQGILEANLEAGMTVLANVKATVKTKERATTGTLTDADRHARETFANGGDEPDGASMDGQEVANRAGKIQKLVNEEMAQLKNAGCALTGNSLRNRAWANAKKHMPNLFSDHASAGDDHEEATEDDDKPTPHKQGPTKQHPGKPQKQGSGESAGKED